MNTDNLLSGLIGAGIGALASFASVFYVEKSNKKQIREERHRNSVATGIIKISLLKENFLNFNPAKKFRGIGAFAQNNDDFLRANQTIDLFNECKFQGLLLPEELRKRWNNLLGIVSGVANRHQWDKFVASRSVDDVNAYFDYVILSLTNYLDSKEPIPDLKPPYLQREDMEVWTCVPKAK